MQESDTVPNIPIYANFTDFTQISGKDNHRSLGY